MTYRINLNVNIINKLPGLQSNGLPPPPARANICILYIYVPNMKIYCRFDWIKPVVNCRNGREGYSWASKIEVFLDLTSWVAEAESPL